MPETIGQRQLRNDNAEILRRVEAGETFVITRNGKPIADLVPHGDPPRRRPTLGELQALRKQMPTLDIDQWYADRAADDALFGDDRID